MNCGSQGKGGKEGRITGMLGLTCTQFYTKNNQQGPTVKRNKNKA